MATNLVAPCKTAAEQFFREVLSPTVALVVSIDADAICLRNEISFAQLLQPFAQLTTEAVIKDPNNQSHSIRDLRVDFRDIRSEGFVLNSLLSSVLSDLVKSFPIPDVLITNGNAPTVPFDPSSKQSDLTSTTPVAEAMLATPWYEEWKRKFVLMMEPADHEFLKHFLACVLVVSSAHPDPLDQLTKLSQAQHSQQHQIGLHQSVPTGISVISGDLQSNSGGLATPKHTAMPKWFSPNIFKFHLLIHDVTTGDDKKAEAVYQSMKMTYGAHACHLLRINSVQSITEDSVSPWVELWRPYLESQCQFSNKPMDNQRQMSVSNSLSTGLSFQLNTENHSTRNQLDQSGNVPNGSAKSVTGGIEVEEYKREVIPHPLSHADLKVLDKDEASATTSVATVKWNRVGGCLNQADMERIRVFFQEFVQRGLLPFVERQMRLLNDQFASRNWRGKSLLTATKGLFGSRAGITSPTAPQANSSLGGSVVYTQESAELQVRRLADLAFLFQHYDLAYNLYHLLKKDFANDQAWMYYAGALEMASLCVFMAGPTTSRPFRHDYIEGALSTYTSCNKYLFACRTTIFCTEMYKSMETAGKAADQFIKMTSGESDLWSALFLEQASLCFIREKMWRKFAIHMILAGHRFSKANQKRHTLRCYTEALKIYTGRNWRLAEDHINYTIGHQSRLLKLSHNCASAFGNLLSRETLQFPVQQVTFVKEYLAAMQELRVDMNLSESTAPSLVLPLVLAQETQVYYGNLSRDDLENAANLETDELLEKAAWSFGKNDTGGFEPTVFTAGPLTQNSECNKIPLREYFTVQLHFLNPFAIPLFLVNSNLLWTFECDDGRVINAAASDPNCSVLQTVTEPLILLKPMGVTKAFLSVSPLYRGRLTIRGIQFGLTVGLDGPSELQVPTPNASESLSISTSPDLNFLVMGCCQLQVGGRRLNKTKVEKTSVVYGVDRRLTPVVSDPVPLMTVKALEPFPPTLMAGELVRVPIRLSNTGVMPIQRISFVTTTPHQLSFCIGSESHCRRQLNWTSIPIDINCDAGSAETFLTELLPIGHQAELSVGDVTDVWLTHFTPTLFTTSQQSVAFLVFYESSVGRERRHRSRFCRFSYAIAPALSVVCRLYSSPLIVRTSSNDEGWKQTTAHVELKNISGAIEGQTTEFHLLQLFCFSRRFKLTRVISDISDVLLNQGEMKGISLDLMDCRSDSQMILTESRVTSDGAEELSVALEKFSFPWSAFMNRMGSASENIANVSECISVLWQANLLYADGTVRMTFGLNVTAIPAHQSQLKSAQSDLSSPLESAVGFVGFSATSGDTEFGQTVCYSLEYNAAVSHDFGRFRLCPIPVRLRVRNVCPYEVELKLGGSSTIPHSGDVPHYYRLGCQPVSWLQLSTRGKSVIPVGEEIQLPLMGVAAYPGVFDLGSLAIWATPSGKSLDGAVFPRRPHYVTVKNQPGPN